MPILAKREEIQSKNAPTIDALFYFYFLFFFLLNRFPFLENLGVCSAV